ncbi:CHASE2 domain-containing protein [Phormidium tenue]|uniref:CHASE2 domain-containing protein n=1 Tax=Phormidium tenue FACHB-1050 TaxID=2692857 RepID=A0ABR8CJJ9_9CYAN|nr:CHASE2 domain-containing protein [Phormidium tenue]MBD2319769.1 CHASE2 domain-containing protein [Phormidium tenue FACHB-1050]
MLYKLKVWHIERQCLFDLTWGKGQQLSARLTFPETLTTLYQTWQLAYLNFYKSALRAKVKGSGSIPAPTIDWRANLVQAEAQFLAEFHYWLNSAELVPIRAEIARAAAQPNNANAIDVFLTCEALELARFPWETWEIATTLAIAKPIRISRSPANIRAEVSQRQIQGKLRVLAVLGDDTGLDFQADRLALRSLSKVAEVTFIGWQAGKDNDDLKEQIRLAIADERGWDILFFAGHSNESTISGGELGIAPNQSIFLSEIAPQLLFAKTRGLQFALFNSCNGLSIAEALIDLGLSQVAVMREPIQNQVAQEFLARFLPSLADGKDVRAALLIACQHLKLEKNLTYPSAYLIPSLFCHPEAVPFCLPPPNWRKKIGQLLPSPKQAIAVSTLAALSLWYPVQDWLRETRVWTQSIYRDVTQQVPIAKPPVLLVQIDEASIQHLDGRKKNILDRRYLAKVLDKVQQLQPKVIGIDYLLDSSMQEYPDEDRQLRETVENTVRKQIWIVFATVQGTNAWVVTDEMALSPSVVNPNTTLRGYVNVPPWYMEVLPNQVSCSDRCPFAYLIALASAVSLSNDPSQPKPNLDSRRDLRSQLIEALEANPQRSDLTNYLHRLRLPAIYNFSQKFDQLWLQPILDFSIPPDRAFQAITAKDLLSDNFDISSLSTHPIVIIAPGGYRQAGVDREGQDNFSVPMAIAYWRNKYPAIATVPHAFVGAEAHAYTVHHFRSRHLVVPIPDVWMMAIALILGRATALIYLQRDRRGTYWVIGLVIANSIYAVASWQWYISGLVLLPWLLPSLTFWICVLTVLRRKSHGAR